MGVHGRERRKRERDKLSQSQKPRREPIIKGKN